jgi:hypothetical protein
MDTPEPVMRNGIMTYAVPELTPSSCKGCRWHDRPVSECRGNDFESVGRDCVASPIIFIEATPEAYAHYVTQRIQKGLEWIPPSQ